MAVPVSELQKQNPSAIIELFILELNSTIYMCRAQLGDYNYSSNPTYLTGSEIRVKANDPTNNPKSFITTVGLYNAQDQLLAVSKLSKPIEKSPAEDLLIKVRLDY